MTRISQEPVRLAGIKDRDHSNVVRPQRAHSLEKPGTELRQRYLEDLRRLWPELSGYCTEAESRERALYGEASGNSPQNSASIAS